MQYSRQKEVTGDQSSMFCVDFGMRCWLRQKSLSSDKEAEGMMQRICHIALGGVRQLGM